MQHKIQVDLLSAPDDRIDDHGLMPVRPSHDVNTRRRDFVEAILSQRVGPDVVAGGADRDHGAGEGSSGRIQDDAGDRPSALRGLRAHHLRL